MCIYGFDQHQNEVTGENLGLPTYHDLVTMKAELVVNPFEDIDNWSIRNVSHVLFLFFI